MSLQVAEIAGWRVVNPYDDVPEFHARLLRQAILADLSDEQRRSKAHTIYF